jgi:hypothetical protein
MKTELYDNPADFMAALTGKKPRKPAKAARDARPELPRAAAGEGDRIAQLMRIAVWGYTPRWDAGMFSFWNPQTGARIAAHADYAQACIAAEKELKS